VFSRARNWSLPRAMRIESPLLILNSHLRLAVRPICLSGTDFKNSGHDKHFLQEQCFPNFKHLRNPFEISVLSACPLSQLYQNQLPRKRSNNIMIKLQVRTLKMLPGKGKMYRNLRVSRNLFSFLYIRVHPRADRTLEQF
jgi:hypothetical protein